MLFQIKRTIRGKDITISIALVERNNYISIEFANELAISKSNIGERLDFCVDFSLVFSHQFQVKFISLFMTFSKK